MIGPKTGIALMNLGSPASPGEVRRFLFRLFMDIEMFQFPGERFCRPLFAALIASVRADRVRQRYRVLGGTSPLMPLTQRQAEGLQTALLRKGFAVPVEVCMRYSHPFASEAVERLVARGARGIVGLPLYPQYSDSTTGSSLRALNGAVRQHRPRLPCYEIRSWFDDSAYHAALAGRILVCRQRMPGADDVGLLFVAHSVPVRFVLRGDPYVEQVEQTVAAVLDVLNRQAGGSLPWLLAYQSRVGPVRWVGPTVLEALEVLLDDGIRSVIVVPVSFVSDHLETLYEIDLHYRRLAFELGCERFERIDSLNAGDDFTALLADLVIRAYGNELSTVEEAGHRSAEGTS